MEDPHQALAASLLEGSLNNFLAVINSTEGWVDIGESEGVKGQRISEEGRHTVRTKARINRPIQDVLAFCWNFRNKPRWDEGVKENREVKSFSENFRIYYEENKAPWPVSNRDQVIAQRILERDDGFLIQNKSIDGVVPEVKGVVRSEVFFSGNYMKRISDTVTEITFCGSIDPRGSIPDAIVKKTLKKQVDKMVALKKALESNSLTSLITL